MPCGRQHLLAHPGLDGFADALRKRRLESRRGFGERLHLIPCPLERGLDDCRLCAPLGGLTEPLVRPLEHHWIHGCNASVGIG